MDAADPRHGTNAGYCAHKGEGSDLCYACRVAHANYETTRHRLKAYGQWNPWVDAQPARNHVRDLMAAGMGIRLIARAAGVQSSRITHLLYGRGGNPPPTRIRPAYAATLLDTEPEPRRVDATGTKRRIAALIAIGYPQRHIGLALGWNQQRVHQILNGTDLVERRTAQAVAGMYERLSMTLPPTTTKGEKFAAAKARNTALRHGYAPPLAWDADSIEDPGASPRGLRAATTDAGVDHAVVKRVLAGERLATNTAERHEIMRRWLAAGKSERSLCVRMSWHDGRYGRGDVA